MADYRFNTLLWWRAVGSVMALLFLSANAIAQEGNKSVSEKDQSFFQIALRFRNDYVYMGRADSIAAPYLTPSVGYYHRSGLYVESSLSYLTKESENRVDLYTVSGGYDYLGSRLSAGGSLSAYFFNQDSYAVQSTMSSYFNSYLGYDFDVVELFVDGSLGLSDNVDFFGGVDLRRTFYVGNGRFRVTPSVYMNVGSQRYYTEYYATRNSVVTRGDGYGKGSGGGKGSGSGTTTTTTSEVLVSVDNESKFQVLDYELSLALTYKAGSFRISFTPVYAIPVNPATVTVDDTTTFTETLDNVFFWSTRISYTF